MIGTLDSKVPHGPLPEKWRRHKNNSKLVAPNNRRRFEIIIVGTGLAGGSAAATLAEQGYQVKSFCYQDSPRRATALGELTPRKITLTTATAFTMDVPDRCMPKIKICIKFEPPASIAQQPETFRLNFGGFPRHINSAFVF